jgi:hypothetical protein
MFLLVDQRPAAGCRLAIAFRRIDEDRGFQDITIDLGPGFVVGADRGRKQQETRDQEYKPKPLLDSASFPHSTPQILFLIIGKEGFCWQPATIRTRSWLVKHIKSFHPPPDKESKD